jgi:hypothetical protein
MWVGHRCRGGGGAMVPQLSAIEEVEGGLCDTPILWGLVGVEVAFTTVDPPQWVTGSVESQEFDTPCQIGEYDLLLLPCPDVGAGMHGGQRTVAV